MRVVPKHRKPPGASKERVVAYIDPQVARRLKHKKAATDKTISLIVEEALDKQLEDLGSLVVAR